MKSILKRYSLALLGLILFSSGICILGESIIMKYESLGFIERCDIQSIDKFFLRGETNIQEKVENSKKNFERLLINRLKD